MQETLKQRAHRIPLHVHIQKPWTSRECLSSLLLTLSKCISLCEKEDSTKREEQLHDSHYNILMLTLPQNRNQAAQST